MGAKAFIAIRPARVRTPRRLPPAVGLAIGACASMGLWAAIITGVRGLLS